MRSSSSTRIGRVVNGTNVSPTSKYLDLRVFRGYREVRRPERTPSFDSGHQPLEHRRQQQHHTAADSAPPEYLQKQRGQGFEIVGVVVAGELAGEVGSERGGHEPDPQYLAHEACWNELGHGGQP